ncbi:CopG family transcriptional regulator [Nocardia alni]|uniref:ribbon-helix-helix domain-containing protein n=1 Tax=Nocardia alni TaxID=2815723 RepID=UPI001C230DD8|nr:CopG family transcriptional regulator [Nocardia alni]
MSKFEDLAGEVLAHSEDDDEWEQEPEPIETKPSGTQVVSARLPAQLAEELLTEAERRGIKPSELIRDALQQYLHPRFNVIAGGTAFINVSTSPLLTVRTRVDQYLAENSNPVVQQAEALVPPLVAALGFPQD